MSRKSWFGLSLVVVLCVPALAQSSWNWDDRIEIRADYRWSDHEQFPLAFPFPPEFLPPGQTKGFEETPDPGDHFELNVVDLQLDTSYGDIFAARAKVHLQDKFRRNPTSSDKRVDADEFYVRLGRKPEFLDRPDGTSFFIQAGKFPKMERQPTRLLESYGLAATSFNRFEDIQLLVGGTVGRNFYWRLQGANGNPLFMRDPNSLAGDNGTPEERKPFPTPKLHSGITILYNAETEGYTFDTDHVQLGEGLGYRWQRADQTLGFDFIAFHYKRTMADEENLTGTFYGGDIDLLNGPFDVGGLPITSRDKEEYGVRLYNEWHGATTTIQFTKQNVAGLQREGWEIETGYFFPLHFGPIESIQPAGRLSGLTNRFRGNPATFPAPSLWWQWTKIDGGVRIGLPKGLDVTLEYTKQNVGAIRKLNLREGLVTFRWRT